MPWMTLHVRLLMMVTSTPGGRSNWPPLCGCLMWNSPIESQQVEFVGWIYMHIWYTCQHFSLQSCSQTFRCKIILAEHRAALQQNMCCSAASWHFCLPLHVCIHIKKLMPFISTINVISLRSNSVISRPYSPIFAYVVRHSRMIVVASKMFYKNGDILRNPPTMFIRSKSVLFH